MIKELKLRPDEVPASWWLPQQLLTTLMQMGRHRVQGLGFRYGSSGGNIAVLSSGIESLRGTIFMSRRLAGRVDVCENMRTRLDEIQSALARVE